MTRPPSSDSAGYQRRCATYHRIMTDTGAADSRKSTIGGRKNLSGAAVNAARQPKPPNPEQTLLTDWTGGNVVPAGPELVARSALGWKGRSEACPPREDVSCEANSRPPKRSYRRAVTERRGRRAHQSPVTALPRASCGPCPPHPLRSGSDSHTAKAVVRCFRDGGTKKRQG